MGLGLRVRVGVRVLELGFGLGLGKELGLGLGLGLGVGADYLAARQLAVTTRVHESEGLVTVRGGVRVMRYREDIWEV